MEFVSCSFICLTFQHDTRFWRPFSSSFSLCHTKYSLFSMTYRHTGAKNNLLKFAKPLDARQNCGRSRVFLAAQLRRTRRKPCRGYLPSQFKITPKLTAAQTPRRSYHPAAKSFLGDVDPAPPRGLVFDGRSDPGGKPPGQQQPETRSKPRSAPGSLSGRCGSHRHLAPPTPTAS